VSANITFVDNVPYRLYKTITQASMTASVLAPITILVSTKPNGKGYAAFEANQEVSIPGIKIGTTPPAL
jgi:hypothetical protein